MWSIDSASSSVGLTLRAAYRLSISAPPVAPVLLDELDHELEKRGHKW